MIMERKKGDDKVLAESRWGDKRVRAQELKTLVGRRIKYQTISAGGRFSKMTEGEVVALDTDNLKVLILNQYQEREWLDESELTSIRML